MFEVWLRCNRRVLFLAMVPVAVLCLLGLAISGSDAVPMPRQVGIALFVAAGLLLVGLIRQLWQPRVAYRNGNALLFLKSGAPLSVPVHVVEAFFLGQGPARLPGSATSSTKTVNLIARLSQRDPQWQHREVKAALGTWAEGYITIRGTWCEPLTTELLRSLNHRLREVSQERAAALEKESTP